MNTVHVTRADEGEHWLVGGDVTTVNASGRDTSGDLLVLEVTVPAGGGPPVFHRHEYSETFLFQEGEFEVSTAYEPVQTATHYAMHLLYGAAQLPLIWLLLGWIRLPRPTVAHPGQQMERP